MRLTVAGVLPLIVHLLHHGLLPLKKGRGYSGRINLIENDRVKVICPLNLADDQINVSIPELYQLQAHIS